MNHILGRERLSKTFSARKIVENMFWDLLMMERDRLQVQVMFRAFQWISGTQCSGQAGCAVMALYWP
jgi:hypothetical protein